MSPVSKIPPGLRKGVAAPALPEEDPAEKYGFGRNAASPVEYAEPGHRPRPSKPKRTRYTLDLDPDQHQFLKTYAASIEADASEVMRGLLRQLEADPGLADRVRDGIWQQS